MRRVSIAGLVVTLSVLSWLGTGFAERPRAPRGELRIVDPSPLNWVSIVYNVFEHLMEHDLQGRIVPRLATGWQWLDDRTLEVKLRRGVKFHNGEAFDADIVRLNWEENFRARQPHGVGPYMNFKPGSRVEVVDRLTVRFVFPEPDGAAIAKLQVMHIGNRQFYREMGWGEKHW
jgi:ABC-type transport system substrate-binding protein